MLSRVMHPNVPFRIRIYRMPRYLIRSLKNSALEKRNAVVSMLMLMRMRSHMHMPMLMQMLVTKEKEKVKKLNNSQACSAKGSRAP